MCGGREGTRITTSTLVRRPVPPQWIPIAPAPRGCGRSPGGEPSGGGAPEGAIDAVVPGTDSLYSFESVGASPHDGRSSALRPHGICATANKSLISFRRSRLRRARSAGCVRREPTGAPNCPQRGLHRSSQDRGLLCEPIAQRESHLVEMATRHGFNLLLAVGSLTPCRNPGTDQPWSRMTRCRCWPDYLHYTTTSERGSQGSICLSSLSTIGPFRRCSFRPRLTIPARMGGGCGRRHRRSACEPEPQEETAWPLLRHCRRMGGGQERRRPSTPYQRVRRSILPNPTTNPSERDHSARSAPCW